MRIQKYLIGIWSAVAVYALFSFFAGPKGISSYNYLLTEREYQWENIKELGILNEELERTRNNLLFDHDTILVQARLLGYGQEDEHFIRIVGLENTKAVPAIKGSVYSVHKPLFISDRNIKIAALCAGLLIFSFLFMLELIDKRTR
ncbi:MAG: septum formation initiator family protein [Treponema sp.]|nr:septum formation initiator family protein [Treponema sp.]